METRARALIAAAALCAAGTTVAALAFAAEAPRRAILVVAREDGLWRVRDDGRATLLLGTAGARAPSWAPSGREIAFERDGTTYVINADGSGRRTLLVGRDPDWSPDGQRVVVERDGTLLVARRNGQSVRRVTEGTVDRQPTWSPDGLRIAFSRDGVVSVVVLSTGAVSAIARGADPAWSPDGRQLAFATDGGIATVRLDTGELRLHTVDGADGAPLFSPDGSEIGVVHAGNIIALTPDGGAPRTLAPGTAADWANVPTSAELLPDLDQRPPGNVAVAYVGGRYRIGFASAVDNVGRGPLWIRGLRDGPSMQARQLVRTSAGRIETHLDAGTLRYTWSTTHSHWHYLAFERYELRRLSDNALVARDRKTGFCLADHYGHALRVRPGPPVFLGHCGTGNPRLRAVEQGSSRGYTDRYPAHYHGQNLDVTGVPAGVYLLVHRANPNGLLRERSYDNNAASVRIRLSRAGGTPRVRVLRTCATSARC